MKFSHDNTTKCAVGSRVSQKVMVFPNVLKLSVGTGLPWHTMVAAIVRCLTLCATLPCSL